VSTPPLLIRAASPADLDAVWAVERAVFGEDVYPRFLFRQALDLWGDLLRVAELPSGEIAGYALGALARDGGGWLLSAAVRPEQRGRGIATQLTRDLLERLAAAGAPVVRLTVHPANAGAVRIYRGLGFHTVAEDPDYFGPGELRLLMQRDLAPGTAAQKGGESPRAEDGRRTEDPPGSASMGPLSGRPRLPPEPI
jgi:ribosomal protein S18 acetylase RimI-like enzyme